RAYRAQVQRQRHQFGLLLPVAPTLLAKEGLVLAAMGAGAAAVGGSGMVASSALKTGFLKAVAAALIAGIGTMGTVVVSASDLPVRSLSAGSGSPGGAPAAHHARRPASRSGHSASGHSSVSSVTGGGQAQLGVLSSRQPPAASHSGRRRGGARERGRGRALRRHPGTVGPRHRHGAGAVALRALRAPARRGTSLQQLPPGLARRSLADLPPGLADRPRSDLPPGQARKLERALPGFAARPRQMGKGRWQAAHAAFVPPGHAVHGQGSGQRADRPGNGQQPRGAPRGHGWRHG
ncbi:MAG TPA: hypothetical protein VFP55_11125, partial [Solirubrobacteraceae bacterium]|nr:hypothetical protein [Solirubrobacteraceae bacterium]